MKTNRNNRPFRPLAFLRRHGLSLALMLLLGFLAVLTAEGFHHHGELESRDHCAFCSWQLTASHAPATPPPPFLITVWMFIFTLVFTSFLFTPSFISPRGRSPPSFLQA